ncbi:MAG: T9SS type A sorting domain-containing protein [Bacteroidales bacterium]
MKFLQTLIPGIVVLFSSFPLYALNITDTIKSIPFIETWDSATFTANAWRFPYTQGNWAISSNSGNPSPCATFTGLPSTSNYINALVSPWFDATGLTCDDINLDFDIKLTSLVNSGSEKMSLIVEYDTVSYTLNTWVNDTGFDWKAIHFNISFAYNKLFRLRFVAFGQYSDLISAWFLDNIAVTRQCRNVLLGGGGEGYCSTNYYTCNVELMWSPPMCNGQSYSTTLEYDDGDAETGWLILPHTIGWLGNEFPLDQWVHGEITKISVYFGFDVHGLDSLTVDIFDNNHILVASSQPFITPNEGWIDLPFPDIPFTGTFYAMVKWNNTAGWSNYLGYDTDGPYSSYDLEWYYDGITWGKIWQGGTYEPSVALIQASVIISGTKKESTLFPARDHVSTESIIQDLEKNKGKLSNITKRSIQPVNPNFEPDSSIVTGYLIYFKESYYDTTFILLTPTPIPGPPFYDHIHCNAYYRIRTVYSDGCISPPSSTLFTGCDVGHVDEISLIKIDINPNPATYFTEINSNVVIQKIDLINLNGSIIKSIPGNRSKKIRINVGDLSPGIYLVSVVSGGGVAVKKLSVMH